MIDCGPRVCNRSFRGNIPIDQGFGQVAGRRAAAGTGQSGLQVVRRLDGNQVVGAVLLREPRLDVAEAAGGAVET